MATTNYGKLTADERNQLNQTELAKVTPAQSMIEACKGIMKNWRSEWGSKPTPQMLTAGMRLFSKLQSPGVEGFYGAMLLRPEGCVQQTQYQIAAQFYHSPPKNVGTANNVRGRSVAAKHIHVTTYGGRPACLHAVIMLDGAKLIERNQVAAVAAATPDKPVKAKPVKAKAKKAKAKPVTPAEPVADSTQQVSDASVLIPAAADNTDTAAATN